MDVQYFADSCDIRYSESVVGIFDISLVIVSNIQYIRWRFNDFVTIQLIINSDMIIVWN